MPYIPVEEHLPGITGLLEYRKETAIPIRDLTQILLRGESTLTEAEREMIATRVSHLNSCRFCTAAHSATVNILLEECETVEKIKENIDTAPVTDKLKALLEIATLVQQSGKAVTASSIEKAKTAGASDLEIHDTVLIAALFCLYNRYVDGLATVAPEHPEFYDTLAKRIAKGYLRSPQGYDHLRKS